MKIIINSLIKKIGQGDKTALDELYEILSKYIYVIALNYVKDRETAEEIVQDTFVKVVENAHSFKYRNGKFWVISICRNLSLDILRRRDRIEFIGIERVYDLPIKDESRDNMIDLREALKQLTDDECDVIVKVYYEDLPVKEIAKVMNKKADTIYKIHSRAINKIEEIMR